MTHDNETELMPFYDDTGSEAQKLGRKIYNDALADRRGFRPDQIGIDAEDVIWLEIFEAMGQSARATPPPSGDAVRLALEKSEEAAKCFYAADTEGLYERLAEIDDCELGSLKGLVTRRILYARDYIEEAIEALRALPAAQPVNPPSAERGEALDAFIRAQIMPRTTTNQQYTDYLVRLTSDQRETIIAALSAPVPDKPFVGDVIVYDGSKWIPYNLNDRVYVAMAARIAELELDIKMLGDQAFKCIDGLETEEAFLLVGMAAGVAVKHERMKNK